MRAQDDPVDAVILAFLDHLEGSAPRPALDHLTAADRRRAADLMHGLEVARGIDPHAVRPPVETLLADTPLAGLVSALDPWQVPRGAVAVVERALRAVDKRVRVELDERGPILATVMLSYLDLRARFVLLAADSPSITTNVRAVVGSLFRRDPDTSRVGVVAMGSDELTTQVLAAEDLGDTVTTPRGERHQRWDPPLPLGLAARRMLEQSAPEWPAFDFDQADRQALDLPAMAAQIAHQIIERESGRAYRGDKRRAYQALVGREQVFADLVARVSAGSRRLDLTAETSRISQAAA
jgi:hypothetical protein